MVKDEESFPHTQQAHKQQEKQQKEQLDIQQRPTASASTTAFAQPVAPFARADLVDDKKKIDIGAKATLLTMTSGATPDAVSTGVHQSMPPQAVVKDPQGSALGI